MELTLNLLWVCVAIAGILAQIVMLSRAAASLDWRATTRQIVAMGCALVILFFVISMTDDLHDQAILFEEKKPSQVLSETANPAPSSAAQAVPFVFLLSVSPGSLTVALLAVRKLIEPPQQVSTVASVLREATDWRAPPPSLI